jgi:hypothetical protein
MRAHLRFPRLWCAPALLLLYQAAPRPSLDEVGHLRLALGVSRGGYRDEEFDCAGNLTRSSPVRYHTVAGQAEMWTGKSFRVAAALGSMAASSDSTGLDLRTSAFGSVLAAYEGAKFGIGGGIDFWPTNFGGAHNVPAIYLRAGRADKLHARVDELASAAPGAPPSYRLGFASGYGGGSGTRWFLGVQLYPFGANSGASLGGELGIPIRAGIQPVLQGAVGGKSQWNLGAGLRVGLGGPH